MRPIAPRVMAGRRMPSTTSGLDSLRIVRASHGSSFETFAPAKTIGAMAGTTSRQ